MRILHILDHSIPLQSGYTFRTRAIVTTQRSMGFETFHITSAKHNGHGAPIEQVDGLEFFRTPQADSWYCQVPLLRHLAVVDTLARRLDEVIDTVKPDILHAHSPALNGLAALRAAGRHGLPVVYECRAFWEDAAVNHGTSRAGGLRYHLTRIAENRVFAGAQAITTICTGLRTDILTRGIPASKVTIVPNAVDVDRFHIVERPDIGLKHRLGLENKTVLGFIGSFYEYEGLLLLLEALPAILQQEPSVRVLLVGGGPQHRQLEYMSTKLGLDGKIIFAGRVPHDSIQDYYDQVDVLVYPRQHMRLTDLVTPLKPLEAMAEGRLVVASDVGGHKELIEDGATGWLFPAGDAQALADCVLKVLANRDVWPRFRAAGRAYVETERTWRQSVERYRDVYAACLGR